MKPAESINSPARSVISVSAPHDDARPDVDARDVRHTDSNLNGARTCQDCIGADFRIEQARCGVFLRRTSDLRGGERRSERQHER